MKKTILLIIFINILIMLFCKNHNQKKDNAKMTIDDVYEFVNTTFVNDIFYSGTYSDSVIVVNYGIAIKIDNNILKIKKMNINVINNNVPLEVVPIQVDVCLYDSHIQKGFFEMPYFSRIPFRKKNELSGHYYMKYEFLSWIKIANIDLNNPEFQIEYEYQTIDGVTKGLHSTPLSNIIFFNPNNN